LWVAYADAAAASGAPKPEPSPEASAGSHGALFETPLGTAAAAIKHAQAAAAAPPPAPPEFLPCKVSAVNRWKVQSLGGAKALILPT